MERYRFRTTLGFVYIALDPDKFDTYNPKGDGPKCFNRQFEIEMGGDFVNGMDKPRTEGSLYDGEMDHVFKAQDGSLWAMTELSDGHYGSPKYLLQKCTDCFELERVD